MLSIFRRSEGDIENEENATIPTPVEQLTESQRKLRTIAEENR